MATLELTTTQTKLDFVDLNAALRHAFNSKVDLNTIKLYHNNKLIKI